MVFETATAIVIAAVAVDVAADTNIDCLVTRTAAVVASAVVAVERITAVREHLNRLQHLMLLFLLLLLLSRVLLLYGKTSTGCNT